MSPLATRHFSGLILPTVLPDWVFPAVTRGLIFPAVSRGLIFPTVMPDLIRHPWALVKMDPGSGAGVTL